MSNLHHICMCLNVECHFAPTLLIIMLCQCCLFYYVDRNLIEQAMRQKQGIVMDVNKMEIHILLKFHSQLLSTLLK